MVIPHFNNSRDCAGAKHSVDNRGVSAGTGSVCKLFVRKARRARSG